ncbi:MAG: 4Fe-4S dicluster domain-containing protein [Lachnospiraceae bacterium]|nr:4Fe-4S dicluster domain-containing protein [Lachnospiraceae bacterium]
MLYTDFQGMKLSNLGFGTMRLPLISEKPDSPVDEAQVGEMVKYAMEHGVNYFDTAYPYHGGESERIIGRALKPYPRETFYLATKYPGHQISKTYDPAVIFEEQLEKCQVEYFDFYLLHNVHESSIRVYTDPKWGIVDYFVEQKKLGRIRHLGFSSHGNLDNLKDFLDRYGDVMEFCQIQLNYLDWTLQGAKEKYELLTKRSIPVWVMEPVRGGKLAKLPKAKEERLEEMRPGAGAPSWAFWFLQGLPNVKMILSGMSNLAQMQENVHTFEERNPLTKAEQETLFEIAEGMKNSIPCTACRYCCEGCPKGLDIPMLLSLYNDLRFAATVNVGMRLDGLSEEKRPEACIGCGKCIKVCPQKIDVPGAMKQFARTISEMPSWEEICRQREEAAKKKKAR